MAHLWSVAAVVSAALNLVPGVATTRAIAGGEQQTFRVAVGANQFVHGTIDQGDTDLIVAVYGPDGREMATYDARERDSEMTSFVAVVAGEYRLVVRPLKRQARRATYRVRLDPIRPATPDDRRLVEAELVATEVKQHMASGEADALRQAIARLQYVQQLWHALGRRWWEVLAAVNTGEAWLALNDYERADAAYAEARALNRELADASLEAEILNGLAMIAWPQGRIADALDLLSQAVDLCRTARTLYGEAASRNNRGLILWEAGEYARAIADYRAALKIVATLDEPRGRAFATNNLALVLEELGKRREARTYLVRAVALFHQVHDTLGAGRALISLARVQLALGAPRAALRDVGRGLTLIESTQNRLAAADGLRQRGRVLEQLGDRSGARSQYERALESYRAVNARRGESEALQALGLNRLADNDCQGALQFFEGALSIRRQNGLRRLAMDSLYRTAVAERACGDLDAARAHLEEAIAETEALRAGLFEKEQRTSFISSRLTYYNAYIDVLVDLHRQSPHDGYDARAFEASERARARELIDRLRELWTGLGDAGDAVLLARERDLRRQLNYWSWQVWQLADRPTNESAVADLRRKIAEGHVRLGELEGHLRESDPRYGALMRGAEPVSLRDIQRDVLDENTVLLEYAIGEQQSHVWAITRDTVTVATLPARADIDRHALALHRLLRTAPTAAAADVSRRRQAAAVLGRMLLAPVAAMLDRRRVLISVDGALHYVPFAALEDPTTGRAFLNSHDLTSVPSASLLAAIRRDRPTRQPPPKLLALLSDPVFDLLDPRVAGRHSDTTPAAVGHVTRPFSRLSFGAEAADRIFQLVPAGRGLKAVGFDATRTLATSPLLRDFRIVHFDTHGFQNDDQPDLSGIVLSLVDRTAAKQDGFVRLQDVYAMRLRADLVVLSACRTGLGRQAGAEGLTSLARAFLSAGAALVLSSLWEVDDEPTAALMEHFYRGLLGDRHLTPAAALRSAQTAIRTHARWRDPYFWAGFVLQGE